MRISFEIPAGLKFLAALLLSVAIALMFSIQVNDIELPECFNKVIWDWSYENNTCEPRKLEEPIKRSYE